MKALVYTAPQALELRDVEPPRPAEGEVLIEIEACGICGSDMHAWHGRDPRRPAPLILGHEAVGTIADGADTGSRVVVNPLVTCKTCSACLGGRENLCPSRQIISMPPREGAFAGLLAMPERNLVPVPDYVSSEVAALTEPLACGWHAVRLAERALIEPISQAKALVIGGGAIGLGAALSLTAHGVDEIWLAETNRSRHPALSAAGGFRVYDPTSDPGPGADTVDLVIDGVGFAPTRLAACRATRPGGVIVHIGLGDGEGGLDIRRMTLQELTFIGSYTYTAKDFRDTAAAIFGGRLGTLDWPEVRTLSEGPRAFADIDSGRAVAPKIILKP